MVGRRGSRRIWMMKHRRLVPVVALALMAILAVAIWGAFTPAARARRLVAELRGPNDPPGIVAQILAWFGIKQKGSRDGDDIVDDLVAIGPPAIPPLTGALYDEDLSVRKHAVDALGRIGDRRAIDPLSRILRSDPNIDRELHHSAVMALAEIGGAEAVDPLIVVLQSGETWGAEEAVDALSRIGDRRAVGPLIEQLAGPFREMCARPLARIGDQRAVPPLIRNLDDYRREVYAENEAALDSLDPDWPNHPAAQRMVPVWIARLADPDRGWNNYYVCALARIDGARALGPIMKSREPDGPSAPSGSIAAIRDPETVDPLLAVLSHESSTVRAAAAEAIGYIGDRRVVPALMPLLDDADPSVRFAATEAIGVLDRDWLKTPRGTAALEEVRWTASGGHLSSEAMRVLGRLGDRRALPVLLARLDWWDPVIQGLVKIGPPAVEPLIEALYADELGKRAGAAKALGLIGDPRAVEPLVVARNFGGPAPIWLKRETPGSREGLPTLREVVFEALGRIGDARAVPALVNALGESQLRDQQAAAKALGDIGSEAVEPLIAALADPNWRTRWHAAFALGRTRDPRAVPPLIRALNDEDALVRRVAADGLAASGDARAVEPLIAALEDTGPGVRPAVAEGLGRLGDRRALAPLEALLETDNSYNLLAAVRGLDRLDPAWTTRPAARAAVPRLVKALSYDDVLVREEAAAALDRIDPAWRKGPAAQAAVTRLITDLKDEDLRVCGAGAAALGLIGDRAAVEPLLEASKRIRSETPACLVENAAYWTAIRRHQNQAEITRRKIIVALSRIGDARALVPLVRVGASSGDAAFRHSAHMSIRSILESSPAAETRAVMPDLVDLLRDQKEATRRFARRTLDTIDPDWRTTDVSHRTLGDLLALLPESRFPDLVTRVLDRVDPNWPKSDPARENLADLIAGVARCGDPDLMFRIIERIDPQWPESAAARQVMPRLLAVLGHGRGQLAAIKALDRIDPNWPRREEARRAVPGMIDDLKAASPDPTNGLIGALDRIDPDWHRREEARAIVPRLIKEVKKYWLPMQEAAAAALKRITGQDFGTDRDRWSDWWESQDRQE